MKQIGLSAQIGTGMLAGIVVGWALQGTPEIATAWLQPLGSLFLRLIKLIIVPLVLASLVTGVCGLGDIRRLGSIGGRTFIYYFLTTGVAVTLGIVLANVLDVGAGYVLTAGTAAEITVKEAPGIADVLLGMIPTNPIQSLTEGNMLQIIVFAILFGMGILAVGDSARTVELFFRGVADVMYMITAWIMRLAPIGVFGLIAPVIANNGPAVLLPLLKLILIAALASVLHLFGVYGMIVRLVSRISPLDFIRKAFPAMAVAFTTSSSSGTLPASIRVAQDNFGVDKSIASFVLPLGATINMDGTAIYQGVCTIFIAQVFGIDLTAGQQLMVILTATLASIGTAGVPGAGMIMLMMVLQSTGLPLEGIALVAGVDRILDMIRTCLNVTGDISCAIVINSLESGIRLPDNTAPLAK